MAHGFAEAVNEGEERAGEFVYQSFSGSGGKSFKGTLEFFPGEVAAPTGPPFRAVCPEFALRVPDFIF